MLLMRTFMQKNLIQVTTGKEEEAGRATRESNQAQFKSSEQAAIDAMFASTEKQLAHEEAGKAHTAPIMESAGKEARNAPTSQRKRSPAEIHVQISLAHSTQPELDADADSDPWMEKVRQTDPKKYRDLKQMQEEIANPALETARKEEAEKGTGDSWAQALHHRAKSDPLSRTASNFLDAHGDDVQDKKGHTYDKHGRRVEKNTAENNFKHEDGLVTSDTERLSKTAYKSLTGKDRTPTPDEAEDEADEAREKAEAGGGGLTPKVNGITEIIGIDGKVKDISNQSTARLAVGMFGREFKKEFAIQKKRIQEDRSASRSGTLITSRLRVAVELAENSASKKEVAWKTSKTGKQYHLTPAGNRVYKD
jgi:hypothetical protein